MKKEKSRAILILFVMMLTVLPCGFNAPAFGEPRPIDRLIFDNLVSSPYSNFDNILDKYCSAIGSDGRRYVISKEGLRNNPIKVSNTLYMFFTKNKGYVFDDDGIQCLKSSIGENHFYHKDKNFLEIVLKDKMFLGMLLIWAFLSLLTLYGNEFIAKIAFFTLLCCAVVFIPIYRSGSDYDDLYNKTALESVGMEELCYIRKIRNSKIMHNVMVESGDVLDINAK